MNIFTNCAVRSLEYLFVLKVSAQFELKFNDEEPKCVCLIFWKLTIFVILSNERVTVAKYLVISKQ